MILTIVSTNNPVLPLNLTSLKWTRAMAMVNSHSKGARQPQPYCWAWSKQAHSVGRRSQCRICIIPTAWWWELSSTCGQGCYTSSKFYRVPTGAPCLRVNDGAGTWKQPCCNRVDIIPRRTVEPQYILFCQFCDWRSVFVEAKIQICAKFKNRKLCFGRDEYGNLGSMSHLDRRSNRTYSTVESPCHQSPAIRSPHARDFTPSRSDAYRLSLIRVSHSFVWLARVEI